MAEEEQTECASCKRPVTVFCRGICRTCYRDPDVRAKFPKKNPGKAQRGGHRPLAVGLVQPTKAPEPTNALPMTSPKVDVLAARAAAGEDLWHPGDKKHWWDLLPAYD